MRHTMAANGNNICGEEAAHAITISTQTSTETRDTVNCVPKNFIGRKSHALKSGIFKKL